MRLSSFVLHFASFASTGAVSSSLSAFMSGPRVSFVPTRTNAYSVAAHFSACEPLRMALDHNTLSSLLVAADPAIQAVQGVVDTAASNIAPAVDATQAAVAPAAGVVDEVATTSNQGWFGFLTGPIEGLIQIIHSVLVAVGVDENAWGASIVALTLLIKILTYPLTRQQLESTNKMQALQPELKQLQTTYASNPDVMNQKIAELYQTNDVNPLAGCIPALVQLPVFIGLYRAILELSKDNKLDEPFLWLPNLEGPVYGADPTHGSDWIFKGWVDGVPSLGWEDTVAFLSLPVILVVSQFISQALITPKNADPQQQNNLLLKVLPLLIGWFSLNVPAALGIYWVFNNVITTLITVQIRSSMNAAPVTPGGGSATTVVEPPADVFRPAPVREKPSGFATAVESPIGGAAGDDVKPITAIDAEVVEDPTDGVSTDDVASEEGFATETKAAAKKRGSKKRKKKGKK